MLPTRQNASLILVLNVRAVCSNIVHKICCIFSKAANVKLEGESGTV
uniref:Uncharacterized protein n=1 Tax=Anguilla anguilla TaxID=7936 RepID=A0A0E9RPE3_ANGAN